MYGVIEEKTEYKDGRIKKRQIKIYCKKKAMRSLKGKQLRVAFRCRCHAGSPFCVLAVHLFVKI